MYEEDEMAIPVPEEEDIDSPDSDQSFKQEEEDVNMRDGDNIEGS